MPSEREGCEDCRWRHVLPYVPHTAEGVSVLVYRTSRDQGVVQLGSFVVAQRTIGFASFPVLGKDGAETGMTVRLCAPPPEEPQRRQSWFRRQGTQSMLKSTGSFAFPPEQLAAIAEEKPAARRRSLSQPRQTRKTRKTRTSVMSRASVWSELPQDEEEDVKWSVKEQDQWPSADEEKPAKPETPGKLHPPEQQPEAEESPVKGSVKDRVRGGAFKLSDSVVAGKA